jgi:hypothetical protein
MIMKKLVMFCIIFLISISSVLALAPSFNLGSCYNPQTAAPDEGSVVDLVIAENCSNYGQIDWTGSDLNLTTLGQITSTEVIIGDGWAYVDSTVRTDLNAQAVITLKNLTFAYQPTINRDDVECTSNCTSITYTRSTGELEFTVATFSNYSVTGRQDFTVYSDTEAYLHGRVYDNVDLGSTYLNDTFQCVVMIFESDEKRLIQTNPEIKKAGKVFSGATSSEANLPEIKGYFEVQNSIGNVYYRDDDIVGYTTFLKVIKCNSDTTELIYEEQITPQYLEPFKSVPSRGVWFIQNAGIVVFIIVAVFLLAMFTYHLIKK